MSTDKPILEARELSKYFDQSSSIVGGVLDSIRGVDKSKIQAVNEVDLSLEQNQVQGVVGESGCGKSTLMRTLLGLHKMTDGELLFDGRSISEYSDREYRRRVQIIFQNPYDTMDPKWTVRETLREPLQIHGMDDKEERVRSILEQVQLNPPEKYLDQLPKQLSGGERQRVAIARALILEPDVVLADEPVSMLDVSTQAEILQLLRELVEDFGVSMLYVSHDLSTVSYVCDRVNVMYLGRIVENAPTTELLEDPKHPYTQALINAIPIPDPHSDRPRTKLEGSPSDPVNLPTGCRFKDRCPERMDICDKDPLFRPLDENSDHYVACHLYYDHEAVMNEQDLEETTQP